MPESHHGLGYTGHRPRPGREHGAEVPGRRRRSGARPVSWPGTAGRVPARPARTSTFAW